MSLWNIERLKQGALDVLYLVDTYCFKYNVPNLIPDVKLAVGLLS